MGYALELMCFSISHENRKASANDKNLEGQKRAHDREMNRLGFYLIKLNQLPFLKQSNPEFLPKSLSLC